jgi:4-amino-4-deoxy-L-arabinose transferase-like glycosyltransferase
MNRLSWSFARIRNHLFQSASFFYISNRLPWLIICLGIVLRFAQYLFNRSLWLDESFLALNITNRSFSELVQSLDYYQGAPVGFSMLERLAVQVFGNSEYALRLFPLLSGVISLFLFYGVAKQCIKPKAVPIALGLFAISDPLIYYSSEVKQYSSDVAIALLLFLVTFHILARELTAPRIALFGVLGATAIWVSYPSVFILAGVGVSLTSFYLGKRDWVRIGSLSIAYSLWALSFVVLYFVSLRSLSSNKVLLDYWSNAFLPFPPLDFSWFINTFFGIFENPAGLSLSGIAALTFLIGCISMFFEKRERFFALISPALLTLLASGFQKYPFKGRLLLFIVPSLLLLIAEGAGQIRDRTRHNSTVIGTVLMGLLFLHPLYFASHRLVRPRTKEEIKPVISYVREHKQDEDVLYLYYASQYAFKYYSGRYGFNDSDYIVGVGSDNWRDYISDLDKLCGNKRLWLLFSHTSKQEKERFFLAYLDSVGTRLDSFKSAGAAVYLYDLSEEGKIDK